MIAPRTSTALALVTALALIGCKSKSAAPEAKPAEKPAAAKKPTNGAAEDDKAPTKKPPPVAAKPA